MKTIPFRFIAALSFCLFLFNSQSTQAQTLVNFETNFGDIEIELFDLDAPLSVANFLGYVERGDYDGTLFHRTQSFATDGIGIVQGGGFLTDSTPIATLPPVVNEFSTDRLNVTGTIAYARTADPDSATSQFFFNTTDNPALDTQLFTVFGEVTAGIDVVNQIQGLDVITATGATGVLADLPVADATLGPAEILAEDNLVILTQASVVVSVPEPTAAVVLAFGGVILSTRRRRTLTA